MSPFRLPYFIETFQLKSAFVTSYFSYLTLLYLLSSPPCRVGVMQPDYSHPSPASFPDTHMVTRYNAVMSLE